MKTRTTILYISVLLLCFPLYSESNGLFSFRLTPGANFPIGESTTYFDWGGAVGFTTEYKLPVFPLLSLRGDLAYGYVPIKSQAEDTVHVFSAGGGAALNFQLFWKLTASAYGTGGYYYPIITDKSVESIGNLYLIGGIGVYIPVLPSISLGVDVHYRKNFDFYNGIGISIGTTYTLLKARPLEIKSIEFGNVFPVLFKYYDTHPVGKAILENRGSVPIKDISVSFFVERYMDNPKQCTSPRMLKEGTETEIELYALFSDKVLEITEGTKVSAKITLEYTLKGEKYSHEKTETLRLYDRNAVTWDDNRKAAAYVTAKDPMVLNFSKNVAGWIKGKAGRAVNANFSTAIGIHEALRVYGINYVVDPTTPFTDFSRDKLAVDYLQFPRQTLKYSSGDCDDLSILYSALLESVGIETAFITIPGHIFIAFSLDMTPEQAKREFLYPDDLVFRDNKAWVPVEVTKIQRNFLEAWETGAKEWRENEVKKQAGFYPMRTSWLKYEPVGFLSGQAETILPPKAEVVNAYSGEIRKFIDRGIYPRVSKLEEQIERSHNNTKYINNLGILYARYGFTDRARKQFNTILARQEYVPALVNMGNIYYLNQEMERALEYYERAARKEPENPNVLLQLARTYNELENYRMVLKKYNYLKSIDSGLASQFAYLDSTGEGAARAAEMSAMKEVVIWEED